ncbi:MAG: hypothetical protein RL711_2088 [Bacteroidota bacterium]
MDLVIHFWPWLHLSYTAEVHRDFIGDVLELFGKSIENLLYLVADNAPVNTRLSDLLGIPFIGCASHRFNLACKKYLLTYEQELSKINSLMVTLRNVKQAGKLRTLSKLESLGLKLDYVQYQEMTPDGRPRMRC